ncbi:hypothetical protein GCM10010191_02120 [Actinomadura vinacea]|uniref:Uncharacterized protein n=1 Tax=Actinomadura vinacea TaxID=115336 RepID=A0ABP5VGK8_9ACTN
MRNDLNPTPTTAITPIPPESTHKSVPAPAAATGPAIPAAPPHLFPWHPAAAGAARRLLGAAHGVWNEGAQ